MILTAAKLKDIRVRSSTSVFEDNGDRYDLLKALERVQKALRWIRENCDDDMSEQVAKEALRETGWEVTDGKD